MNDQTIARPRACSKHPWPLPGGSPARVRDQLIARGLAMLGRPGALWLASAAAVALSWRRGPDGAPTLAPPTTADVDALASSPEAATIDASTRGWALGLLRSVATP